VVERFIDRGISGAKGREGTLFRAVLFYTLLLPPLTLNGLPDVVNGEVEVRW
jgi:hypothetical protein